MEPNYISRFKSELDGKEYFITTKSSFEHVIVKVDSEIEEDTQWENYSVIVQDLSDNTVKTLQLSVNGECDFWIQLGNKYSINLPKVGNIQPKLKVYTATADVRTVVHTYSESEATEEKLNLSFYSKDDDVSFFDNMKVEILVDGESKYSGTINNGYCSITIPYGVTYQVKYPQIEGYRHDHQGEIYTAGVPTREIFIRYFYQDAGILAIDRAKNYYTISEVEQAIENGKPTDDFIAVAFLDDELKNADRGDGTTGCEFMFSVDTPTFFGAQCNQNLDFGGNSPVDLGEDVMPYINSADIARTQYAGMKYTRQIIACGKKLNDSGLYGKVTTPAADGAVARTISFNDDTTRNGYMLGYAQLEKLSLQQELIDLLYETLDKSSKCPILTIDYWCSSCQSSATNTVCLTNGSFHSRVKNGNFYVLTVYDLP